MTASMSNRTTLGQCAIFQNGGAWSQDEYALDGLRVVRVTDIQDDTIDLSCCKYLPFESLEKYKQHVLRRDDLVICTVGSHPSQPGSVVGRAVTVPQIAAGALLNQNAVCVRSATKDVDQRWLAYLGRSPQMRSYIIQCAQGSANQVRMAIGLLKKMPVTLPPLAVQQRVAAILSAYDDLIENNTRRIAILEEMARRIFEEWFVRFRAPGCETSPLVDSSMGKIPKGWTAKKLGALIAGHIGGGWGKDAPDQDHKEPAWVIRGTDIPEARSSQFGRVPYRYHSNANLRSRKLQAGDIVFEVSGGSKGQPVGRALLVTSELLSGFGDDAVMCASFCKRIQPNTAIYGAELLYLSFREGYETGEIERFQVQSTGISNFKWTDYLQKVERAVPPDELRIKFGEIVRPLFSLIGLLGLQIANLRAQRDLLLPKLISGEIDVSRAERVMEAAE